LDVGLLMDGQTLKAMRQSFGITQADLAHRLNIDPQTISRWERGKTAPSLLNGSRVGRVLWNIGSSNGNRGALYGAAMVPERLLKEVKFSPAWQVLAWGERLLLIEVSEGMARAFPPVPHFRGFEMCDLLFGEGCELYERYLPVTSKLLAGSTTMVRFVTPLVINIPGIVAPGWYQHSFDFPSKGLIRMTTAPISQGEYDVRKGEAEFID
jgi:DNA-binding XRE family transcriptional regulator